MTAFLDYKYKNRNVSSSCSPSATSTPTRERGIKCDDVQQQGVLQQEQEQSAFSLADTEVEPNAEYEYLQSGLFDQEAGIREINVSYRFRRPKDLGPSCRGPSP